MVVDLVRLRLLLLCGLLLRAPLRLLALLLLFLEVFDIPVRAEEDRETAVSCIRLLPLLL